MSTPRFSAYQDRRESAFRPRRNTAANSRHVLHGSHGRAPGKQTPRSWLRRQNELPARTVGTRSYGHTMADAHTRIDNLKEDIREIGFSLLDLQARSRVHDSKLEKCLAILTAHGTRLDSQDARFDAPVDQRAKSQDARFDAMTGSSPRRAIRCYRQPIRPDRRPASRGAGAAAPTPGVTAGLG